MPAVDASSPALALTQTGAVATASFTPPASALLVAAIGQNQTSGGGVGQPTVSMSSTGVTGLTWTTQVIRSNAEAPSGNYPTAAIVTAPLPSSVAAMTVTFNSTGFAPAGNEWRWISLYVVTDADTASPAGTVAENNSTTDPLSGSVTAATSGSLLFVAVSDWNATGVPTSTTLTVRGSTGGTALTASSGYRAMSAAGVATSFDFDTPGTGPRWLYAAAEIKAASALSPPPGGPPYRRYQHMIVR